MEIVTPKSIAFCVILSAVVIIMSVILLFAAWKNRAMLLVPWLVSIGVLMIGCLIYIMYEMVMADSWTSAGIAVGMTISGLGTGQSNKLFRVKLLTFFSCFL